MKYLSRSILILMFLLGLSLPAFACICVPSSIEKEVKNTEFIFVGKVVEIVEEKNYVPLKVDGISF